MAEPANNLVFLDQCLTDSESLIRFTKILDRLQKCCQAIKRNMNLADICNEPTNLTALAATFGEREADVGFQILAKLALGDHTCRSFSLNKEIKDQRKFLFIHQQVAGWTQFDAVITFQIPSAGPTEAFLMVNPAKQHHWKQLKTLPVGTLVSVYIKLLGRARSTSQELLATDKYYAIFDTVQNRASHDVDMVPVVQLKRHATPAARPRPSIRQSTARSLSSISGGQTGGTPVASTKVVVNKIDVFIHAGNAHMIIAHCKDYAGRVDMYVQRDVKKKIQLDADSIWSAEIRNGETVIFEFFGPHPSDEFLKDLAKKVNKYTQMDKLE